MTPDRLETSAQSSGPEKMPLMEHFASLPHERLFDDRNADAEQWSDARSWRREEDPVLGHCAVRLTSRYGEYVRPLDGGRASYRPTAEGARLIEEVGSRLAEAGFPASDPSVKLYLEDFGTNLGLGLSPAEALFQAYDGEWNGKGTPEARAMWPDRWPAGRSKPKQWDFEDVLGIKR